jgi:hypothetical protein
VSTNIKPVPAAQPVEPDPLDLIPLAKGAGMLGLSPDAIRKRSCGTAALTIILQGRRLFLVREEVVAHRANLIENARRRTDVLRLVKNG